MENYIFNKQVEETEIEDLENSRKLFEYNKASKELNDLLNTEIKPEDKDKIREILSRDPLNLEEGKKNQINPSDIEKIEEIINNRLDQEGLKIVNYLIASPNAEDIKKNNIVIEEIIESKKNIKESFGSLKNKRAITEEDRILLNFDLEADEKEIFKEISLEENKIAKNIEKLDENLTLSRDKIKTLKRCIETSGKDDSGGEIGLKVRNEIKRLDDEVWRIEKVINLLNDESFQYVSGIENY